MDISTLKDQVVKFLEDKKAKDISVIEISKVSSLADYFIICSASSTTHVKALADEVDFKIGEMGINPKRKEGYSTARWVLLDYGDVVLHVFHEEDRAFYNLDRLWSDGVVTVIN